MFPTGIADVYNVYLNKYVRLDNNTVEKIGTGKLIAIMQSGSKLWMEIMAEIIEK